MTARGALLLIVLAGASAAHAADNETPAGARGPGDELDPDAWWRALFPEPWAAGIDITSSGRHRVAPGDARAVESRLFVHRLWVPARTWGGRVRVTATGTRWEAADDLQLPEGTRSLAMDLVGWLALRPSTILTAGIGPALHGSGSAALTENQRLWAYAGLSWRWSERTTLTMTVLAAMRAGRVRILPLPALNLGLSESWTAHLSPIGPFVAWRATPRLLLGLRGRIVLDEYALPDGDAPSARVSPREFRGWLDLRWSAWRWLDLNLGAGVALGRRITWTGQNPPASVHLPAAPFVTTGVGTRF